MGEPAQKLTPYKPNGPLNVSLNLADLSTKASRHGIGHVIAETVYNLCLMTNDLLLGGNRAERPIKTASRKTK